MALIPPSFLDCVVSLGMPDPEGVIWIGTGFIVGHPVKEESGQKQYLTFLVTNKHVLEDRTEIIVRFAHAGLDKVIDYPVGLSDDSGQIWIGNPSESIDIAAFHINHELLNRDSAVFSFFSLVDHAVGIAEMAEMGVSEGDGVFVLGFPMGIVANQTMNVIARSGSVARIRDVLSMQESSILIDANIFPGNSGGPVILKPELAAIEGTKSINRSALIGIVKSYVPYTDIAVSQQTGNPRVIFEENSGLALVETVDNIRSTVELCHKSKVRSGVSK